MKITKWTGLIALALALTTACAAGAEKARIVTLGDSITKGARSARGGTPAVAESETFASCLERMLSDAGVAAEVVNVGVGGEKTNQALARLDKAVLALKPDVVTIMYGTNDSCVDADKDGPRLALKDYEANLRTLVERIRQSGATPILMTEPRLGDQWGRKSVEPYKTWGVNWTLEVFMAAVRKTAVNGTVPLVDHFSHWTRQAEQGADIETWMTDSCHPNADGHRILAETMLPVVRAVLAARAAGKDWQPKAPKPQPRGYSIPTIDLDTDTHRQVVVDREKGQYLGHPTTVLLDDNKTMIVVYPKGHGKGAIVMKRSTDAGLTWSDRLPTPASWATSKEVPTIYPVVDAKGVKRLILFSGLYPVRMAVSEDDGRTWGELEPIGEWGGVVAMGDLTRLRNGDYLAVCHDDGRYIRNEGARTGIRSIYQTISKDGGLTWSQPQRALIRGEIAPCEPGLVRSPDGKQLAMLLRENLRVRNSYVIFSNDEGRTWSDPRELPGSLTGDRHQAVYAPDGRLVISFRDRTHESPTKGDWVAWIGTYDDIATGREGQYRVRLKDNTSGSDCAYPAMEVPPDGTIIATTYGHWTKGEKPYILSVRFTVDEIDARAQVVMGNGADSGAVEQLAKPQAGDSKRVVIVDGGKVISARYSGNAWVQKDGYVEGSGKGNPLVANCEILEGNFHISARLRMLKQKGSAASFAMDRNYFGFEGAKERVFLNGKIFEGQKQLKPSPDVFERGAWIDFDVVRLGTKVSFLIDGRLILTAPQAGEGFREILFHPARSTMQIQEFSIIGNVGKAGKTEETMPRGYSIPILDLNDQTHRQVVVDREKGQYLGHPTTVLLDDNKTMIVVYPKGHGRGAIVMKRSTDAGLTWSDRLPTPATWATSMEVPTIYPVVDKKGVKRLIMFSGLYPTRLAVSEDDGKTWGELEKVGDWSGIVVMSDLIRLTNGDYMVMFHDDGRFFTAKGKKVSTFTLFKSFSSDGGLTWSQPEAILARSDVHLCEPGFVRSPDGKQIAVLLRENARRRNSYVIFSEDEGRTWSEPRELPGALTGDRHQCVYAPDGRLFISFRDRTHESPTKGDWVGWVGTYDDILAGREGQYRVRLKDNHKGADCSYPAVELLPDGTIIATTYGHWVKGEVAYILSVRFKIEELDAMARRLSTKITIPQYDLSEQKQRRVIVDKIAGKYLGQPDTVLLKDGKTILVCYPNGHGGPDTVLKRSDDGGLTWSDRLPVPESFLGNHNAPTIHRVTDAKGVDRLILFVSHPAMKLSVSEDEGKTWSPLKPIFPDEMKGTPGYRGYAPPKSVVRLTDGRYLAMYHDRYTRDGKTVIESHQIISKDGGLTWSQPRCVTRHPLYPGAHPCEPGIIRSPDGDQLLCMLRENSRSKNIRQYNSMYMVSNDEGETWSDLKEMPGALKGDRHIPRYTPDGRIITTIRDVNNDSDTYGDFVLWVGTYADILAGREGQYRVRLLDNKSPRIGDTGYSGLVLLPDGTFVSTTYCVLAEGEQPLIVSVRFTMAELDAIAAKADKGKPKSK